MSDFFATPTVARQVLLSMGFPRQEYWSVLPFPSLGESFRLKDWICISCIGRRTLPLNPQGSPLTSCHSPISPGGFFQGLQLSCPILSTLHYFLVSLHQEPTQLFWEDMSEFIFLITGNILLYPTYVLSTFQILTFKSQFYYKELALRIPPK